jgi:hypothetical protein
MKAEHELLHAYREWLRLARAETKAIQTRNWNLLSDCQLAIKDFQVLITRLTLEARAEWDRAGENRQAKEQNVQVFVNELIDRTRYNQGLLESATQAARQQLGQLGEAGRNLKLLQRSYGLTPSWSLAV